MSQETEKIPDIRSLFERRKKDEGRAVIEEFVKSNANNPTKSRIPSVYGMTVFQMLGAWSSNKPTISITVQGAKKDFVRDVNGLSELFKMLYDENAISAGGESRKELETASLGYFLRDIEDIEKAKTERATEGVKKK